MASDILLHTNCTTGVEAFALGKPAISLQPGSLRVAEIYLANLVNYRTQNVAEALEVLEKLLAAGPAAPPYPSAFAGVFDHFFTATTGAYACERIVTSLQEDLEVIPGPSPDQPQWRPRPGYIYKLRMRKHHTQVMPDIDCGIVERILL